MSDQYTNKAWQGTQTAQGAAIDEGLRAYMLRVYNLMALAMVITGLAAWVTYQMAFENGTLTALGQALYDSHLRWVVMLAPLGMVFFLSARLHKLSPAAAQTSFWIFSALMGISISFIFVAYTQESIMRVFFITAASFAGLSLYGYTTKRSLSGMGSFLMMGLIGLIIASLVNIFLESSAFSFAISVIGVLIFAGLTAYDTQNIKNEYFAGDASDVSERKAISGALRLYLDFLNLFMFLLQLFGSRE